MFVSSRKGGNRRLILSCCTIRSTTPLLGLFKAYFIALAEALSGTSLVLDIPVPTGRLDTTLCGQNDASTILFAYTNSRRHIRGTPLYKIPTWCRPGGALQWRCQSL